MPVSYHLRVVLFRADRIAEHNPGQTALATVPEAADAAAVRWQRTGQSPNVSKKIGAEMDSAGDKQASPDEQ